MKDTQNKALYSFADKDVAGLHVHISSGNGKIGHIWNVSTVPGDALNAPSVTRDGKQVRITDVPGTCGGVCKDCHNFCYAFDSIRQHHNACAPSWSENTLLYRKDVDRFMKEIDDAITEKNSKRRGKKVEEFRINVSGELESYRSFLLWIELAKKHPETRFGIYTKRFSWVVDYLKANNKFPENFFVNASEWNHNIDSLKPQIEGKTNIFAYCDSLAEAQEYLDKGYKMCKAIDYRGRHTGIKCDECGYCYGRYGIINVFVLDHSSAGRRRLAQEAKKLKAEGKLDEVTSRIAKAQEVESKEAAK